MERKRWKNGETKKSEILIVKKTTHVEMEGAERERERCNRKERGVVGMNRKLLAHSRNYFLLVYSLFPFFVYFFF